MVYVNDSFGWKPIQTIHFREETKMIRKAAFVLVSVIVCLGMLISLPANTVSFADTDGGGQETNEPSAVSDPYLKQDISGFYSGGDLALPESVTDENITVNAEKNTITFKCTQEQYSSGKFVIGSKFNFDSAAPVGRISVDGLADRKLKASVSVFLDDEPEPAAVFHLKNQMGKKAWDAAGDLTEDVLDMNITGEHQVSFSIDIENADAEKPDQKYQVMLRTVEFSESSLPVLYFDIDESITTINEMNSDPEHDTECYGSVTVQVPDGYKSEYSDDAFKTKTYDLDYIKGRGNSTWGNDKNPYKVKLDKKKDLFGMGENKHWILLANRFDNSLLRNKITYWLGDQLGMPYTPQLVPVDVVMNGVYYGSYFLCEQIRIGESRVAIDDLEDTPEATTEPEITGGYLISMGSEYDEKGGNDIRTKREAFLLEKPEFEDYMNTTQLEYIKKYMQKTENAIFGKDFKDAKGVSYSKYLDVNAAIDYFWIQMFTLNGDAYLSNSTYLYKTRDSSLGAGDGKLFWGPLWDFDYVAWGDLEYNYYNVTGFPRNMTWVNRLLKNKTFAKKYVARWPAIRAKLQEIVESGGQLDEYYEQMIISQRYDNEKYGYYGEEEYEDDYAKAVTERTYKAEIEQLRTWIKKRIKWVDANVNKLIPKDYKVTFKAKGKVYRTRKVTGGMAIGSLPKGPAKKGYTFKGWYYNKKKIKAGTIVRQNMTVYAKYVKKSKYKAAKKLYFLYSKDSVNLYDQTYYKMPYTVRPLSATPKIKWYSSNKSIATVSSTGRVKLKKTGKVTITGKISKKVRRSYTLYICNYDSMKESPKSVKLNKTFMKLKKGRYAKLTPNINPVKCYHERGKFISMDKKIATVSQTGVVTGKKKGTTYILYYMRECDKYAKCKVKVTKK